MAEPRMEKHLRDEFALEKDCRPPARASKQLVASLVTAARRFEAKMLGEIEDLEAEIRRKDNDLHNLEKQLRELQDELFTVKNLLRKQQVEKVSLQFPELTETSRQKLLEAAS